MSTKNIVKPANSGHSRETEKVAAVLKVFNTVMIFSGGGGGGILSGRMKQVTVIDRWQLRRVWL